jgi:hypothetical protein
MSFLSSLFKWLLKVILAILVILAICFVVYMTFGAATMTFMEFCSAAFELFIGLEWYAIPVALGFGYLVDPDLTTEMVAEVGEAVAATAGYVAELTGDAVSGVVSGIASSPWILLPIGIAIWYFFFKEKPKSTTTVVIPDSSSQNVSEESPADVDDTSEFGEDHIPSFGGV